jgi:hypothetical protein
MSESNVTTDVAQTPDTSVEPQEEKTFNIKKFAVIGAATAAVAALAIVLKSKFNSDEAGEDVEVNTDQVLDNPTQTETPTEA